MTDNTEEQKQGTTFVLIPGEVAFNKKLNQTDGYVFWIIKTLDSTEKHCWAGNDYIAKKLNVSTTTISTSISKLKKEGYIKQINFDGRKRILAIDNNYHEKYRYLVEKYNSDEISLKENLKADFKKTLRQPLRKLKTDNNINKDSNKTIINDSISETSFAQDIIPDNENDIQKEILPVKTKNIRERLTAEKLIKYWSDLGYTTNHLKNTKTKIYEKMIKKLIALQKGTFKNIGPFDPDWITKNKIPENWFAKAWTYPELQNGLLLASRYSLDDYWVNDKTFWKSLDNILYHTPRINNQMQPGNCWLFAAMKNPPTSNKQKFQKIPFEKTVDKLLQNPKWPKGNYDKYKLGSGIKELKEFSDNLVRDEYNKSHQYFGTLPSLLKEYIDWMYEQDWITINESILGVNNKVFKKFIEFQSNDIGIQIKSKGWK